MIDTTDTHEPPFALRLNGKLQGDFKEVDRAMLLAGKTDQEIADEFGIHRTTVIKYRRSLGYRTVRTIADDR